MMFAGFDIGLESSNLGGVNNCILMSEKEEEKKRFRALTKIYMHIYG
jgi:hypothetical protein